MPRTALAARVTALETTFQLFLAAEEKRRAEEESRRAAEEKRRAEERAAEEKRLAAEEKRRAEERAAEEKRRAEEDRLLAEKWEAQRAADRREGNRIRGEIANKWGTLAEDMVAPSIPRVVAEIFGVDQEDVEHLGPRVRRRAARGRRREFDVVAAWEGWFMIVEVKTRLRPEDVRATLALLGEGRDYFPEYAPRKLAGAVASFHLDDSVARHAERRGLIVLGLGEDLFEPKNSSGFRPRAF